MEGIDLALLIQIFKGFKSTLPRPAPPRRICQFLRGGAALFPWGGAGWGEVHIPDTHSHDEDDDDDSCRSIGGTCSQICPH